MSVGRHENPHNSRDHFHEPPNCENAVDRDDFPKYPFEMTELVLEFVEKRRGTAFEQTESINDATTRFSVQFPRASTTFTPSPRHRPDSTNVRKSTARTPAFWTVNDLKSIISHCKPDARLPTTINFGNIQRLTLCSTLPSHFIVARNTNQSEFEVFLNSCPEDLVEVPTPSADPAEVE